MSEFPFPLSLEFWFDIMRVCETFLTSRWRFLADLGYRGDPARIEKSDTGNVVFYHYTHRHKLDEIMNSGGLRARLPVLATDLTPEFEGCFFVEGLLVPDPKWLSGSYFGDLPIEMVRQVVGDYLLRIEVRSDFPGLYVVDHAHGFECKHVTRRGRPALDLGYDCRTGHEVVRATVHSLVPVSDYRGGHVAPGIQAIRKDRGITIPWRYISVSEEQPLSKACR